jgi:hypothetical protein
VIGGPPLIRGELNQQALPLATHLFGAAYSFTSLDNARLHIFFWKALIITHSVIYQAQVLDLAHTHEAFTTDPTTHQEYLFAGFYADQFCRSIPYFLQGHVELWGMVAVLVSMPHTLKVYIHLRNREKFSWCLEFCSFLSSFGIEMATYVKEAWRKTWFLAEDPAINSMLSLSLRYGLSKEIPFSAGGTHREAIEVEEVQGQQNQ